MPSGPQDTRRAAEALKNAGAELILFAGGMVRRDLVDAVGQGTPVLGNGCKMHSAVYAINPEAAGSLLTELASGELVGLQLAEVRDIDEDAFREELSVPVIMASSGSAEARYLQQVNAWPGSGRPGGDGSAAWMADNLEDDTYYLMGPVPPWRWSWSNWDWKTPCWGWIWSTTTKWSVGSGRQGPAGGNRRCPARAVITVISGQEHLFGRGNQQFSPACSAPGARQYPDTGNPHKLKTLAGRPLVVDTGDAELDRELCGCGR